VVEPIKSHQIQSKIRKLWPRSFSGLLVLFMLAHFCHHVVTALAVPLLPFIRNDFVLDYTQSGLVISAFTLSYGFGQLPGGWLADRVGPRIMITMGISGVAVAGLLVGLSQTYMMMIVFLVLMGVAGGGYHPAAPPLISKSIETKNQGRALGFHLMGGSASHFVTPLIGVAIATAWGWRGSYIGLAVPTIVFGIIFYGLLDQQETMRKKHSVADSDDEKASIPDHLRRLAAFMVLSTFTYAVIFSVIPFIPLFMVDQLGVDEKTAAASLAIIYSAGFWAGPLGGYLSDRLGRVRVILGVCFVSGPIIYLLNLVPYGVGFGIVLILIGMIVTMRTPVSEAYIVAHSPERRRSTILGISWFSGMEGAGVLTPVVGYLIDHFGFYLGFTIAGAALVALTSFSFIWLWDSRD
jgi:MFS family permease